MILVIDGDSGAGILVVHHFVFNLDGNHLIIIADCDDSAGLSFFLGGVGDVKAGSCLCFSFLNLDQDSVLQRFDGHLEPSRSQCIVAIGIRYESVTYSPENNIRKGESEGQVKTCFRRHLPSIKAMGILSSMRRPAEVNINFADETRRFFSIQLSRYLESRCFSGLPEHDAVFGMIQDAWVELRSSGALNGLSRAGRDATYVTTIIVFPSFVADAGLRCIPVDFVNGRRLDPGEQIITGPSRPTMDM